jgi:methylated-DNA-[protein]-cysteine S-methyltransferase
METVVYRRMDSPLGPILVAAGAAGLKRIGFEQGHPAPDCPPEWEALTAETEGSPAGRALLAAVRQIGEYFAGDRRDFDLPLDADGNPFQQKVWRELCRIPYGETWTYGHLAGRIGRPGSARAVGSANARNPLPIVVPCHRVIGANGQLTGYYGGLHLKAFLLELERGSGAPPQQALL